MPVKEISRVKHGNEDEKPQVKTFMPAKSILETEIFVRSKELTTYPNSISIDGSRTVKGNVPKDVCRLKQ